MGHTWESWGRMRRARCTNQPQDSLSRSQGPLAPGTRSLEGLRLGIHRLVHCPSPFSGNGSPCPGEKPFLTAQIKLIPPFTFCHRIGHVTRAGQSEGPAGLSTGVGGVCL